eukprot:GHVO01040366.1.p2 GENE.GHVO01040366.1~~GHVO01040366.1.p2  ORF type:complete len:111 (+),score=36.64 GHVO01040366.1:279-611(+)
MCRHLIRERERISKIHMTATPSSDGPYHNVPNDTNTPNPHNTPHVPNPDSTPHVPNPDNTPHVPNPGERVHPPMIYNGVFDACPRPVKGGGFGDIHAGIWGHACVPVLCV